MKAYNYYIYMVTNTHNTVIYIGITNDLVKRIWQHKKKLINGFTKRYNADKLVYYEEFEWVQKALAREKELKGWKRTRKDKLVSSLNPEWQDLYPEII